MQVKVRVVVAIRVKMAQSTRSRSDQDSVLDVPVPWLARVRLPAGQVDAVEKLNEAVSPWSDRRVINMFRGLGVFPRFNRRQPLPQHSPVGRRHPDVLETDVGSGCLQTDVAFAVAGIVEVEDR